MLIKVLGGPVVDRQSGIIAGMSGSPVYFNGKMLGAIAIGWGFPKEPIGGVTPITQMIEAALPDPERAKMAVRPASNHAVTKTARATTPTYPYVPRTALERRRAPHCAARHVARPEPARPQRPPQGLDHDHASGFDHAVADVGLFRGQPAHAAPRLRSLRHRTRYRPIVAR